MPDIHALMDACFEQGVNLGKAPRFQAIDPPRGEGASEAETRHERRQDRRDGAEAAPHHERELSKPDELINESGSAGKKEAQR